MNKTIVENKELLDVEWVALIMYAREMGLSIEDVRSTLDKLQNADVQNKAEAG